MTPELEEIFNHPSVHQMLRYSFVGSRQTVKEQVKAFIEETGVDELIAVSAMYDIKDRIKSARLFAGVMDEINAGE
jgi:alkanesulfonate monooxygenase SsuD/methylene tetrahydromethanopterin reductase-like flavin-dependent oxidoreductase (luciferase family)